MKNNTDYPDKMFVDVRNREDFNKAIRFATKFIQAKSNSGHFISKYWAKQHYLDDATYITFIWNDKLNSYITNIYSDKSEQDIINEFDRIVKINNILDTEI